MTTYTAQPIAPATLEELRDTDDAGRPCVAFTATDDAAVGSPLRCCLRSVEPGERIALVSYAPLRRWSETTGAHPGAYDEQGPVFIHADDCGGPAPDAGGYPFDRPGALRTVRRYDAEGTSSAGASWRSPRTRRPASTRRSPRRSATRTWRSSTCGPWSTAASSSRCAGRGRTAARPRRAGVSP